jgi:hypothetical protein
LNRSRGTGPNSQRRPGRGDRRGYPPRKQYSPKKRRLNMKRMTEFKWELNQIMQGLPENERGTIKGSIIAKADKMELNVALDFIDAKKAEGVLNQEMADRIIDLLHRFSTYR